MQSSGTDYSNAHLFELSVWPVATPTRRGSDMSHEPSRPLMRSFKKLISIGLVTYALKPAASVRKPWQFRHRTIRLETGNVHLHGEQRVIAVDADKIDNALLAETLVGTLERCVRDALVAQ